MIVNVDDDDGDDDGDEAARIKFFSLAINADRIDKLNYCVDDSQCWQKEKMWPFGLIIC